MDRTLTTVGNGGSTTRGFDTQVARFVSAIIRSVDDEMRQRRAWSTRCRASTSDADSRARGRPGAAPRRRGEDLAGDPVEGHPTDKAAVSAVEEGAGCRPRPHQRAGVTRAAPGDAATSARFGLVPVRRLSQRGARRCGRAGEPRRARRSSRICSSTICRATNLARAGLLMKPCMMTPRRVRTNVVVPNLALSRRPDIGRMP